MKNTDDWETVGLIDGYKLETMDLIAQILGIELIENVMFGSVYYCVKVPPSEAKRARLALLAAKQLEGHWFRVTDANGDELPAKQGSA